MAWRKEQEVGVRVCVKSPLSLFWTFSPHFLSPTIMDTATTSLLYSVGGAPVPYDFRGDPFHYTTVCIFVDL